MRGNFEIYCKKQQQLSQRIIIAHPSSAPLSLLASLGEDFSATSTTATGTTSIQIQLSNSLLEPLGSNLRVQYWCYHTILNVQRTSRAFLIQIKVFKKKAANFW